MTGIQELHDEALGLEAQLHGKRLELAMAQGEGGTAGQHLRAMERAIQAQRAFRLNAAGDAGQCFFDAAGESDARR